MLYYFIFYILVVFSFFSKLVSSVFFGGDPMGIRNSFNSWDAMAHQRLQLGPGRWLQQWFHSLAWAPSVQNMFQTNLGLSGQENDFNFNHWILDGFVNWNHWNHWILDAFWAIQPHCAGKLHTSQHQTTQARGPAIEVLIGPYELVAALPQLFWTQGTWRNSAWHWFWSPDVATSPGNWADDADGSRMSRMFTAVNTVAMLAVKTVLDMAVPNVRVGGFRIPTTWRLEWRASWERCWEFGRRAMDVCSFNPVEILTLQMFQDLKRFWIYSSRIFQRSRWNFGFHKDSSVSKCFQRSCQGLAKA